MITRTLSQQEESSPKRSDHLYFVLDASHLGQGARFCLEGIDEIRVGRGNAGHRPQVNFDKNVMMIACPDTWMSSQHAVLTRLSAHWVVVDQESRNGVSVNGGRQARSILMDGDLVDLGNTFFVIRENEVTTTQEFWLESDRERSFADTLDPNLATRFDELVRVARSRTPVLVTGATGTGKERTARAVHKRSERSGAFVPVNCGALPAGLVESELFGHRRGAFSGAIEQQQGLVLASSGGTLFLDEIGDLPLAAQAALLRVLEEHEVRAVGADTSEAVDLRVVATTHRDLRERVAAGTFRDDLHARLMGFALELPPLAERRVDLGVMLGELLPSQAQLSSGAARAMMRFAWPRNVRELARVAERAHALANGGSIELAHLPDEIRRVPAKSEPSTQDRGGDTARRAELVTLLEKHKGNITHIAAELGKARTQVQRWLKRHDLDASRYR